MSVTSTAASRTAAGKRWPGSAAAPPVGRRSRWRVAAGLLVVIAAAAGFVAWNTAASQATGVLVVNRPVPVGQPITAADLRVLEVPAAPGMAVVPESELGAVVGRPAAVPLLPGAVLSPDQVGAPVLPAQGQLLVSVAVPLPPPGLAPGARVRVLITAGVGAGQVAAGAPADGQLGLVTPATAAIVVDVGPADGTGARAISLLLAAEAGEPVAAAAATGRVSLLLEPGEVG
jgi:SAF domain-containing protein